MGMTDYGVEKLGSFLYNESVTVVNNMTWGTGSGAFNDDNEYLNAEVDSSALASAWVGDYIQYSAVLTTTQANGSNIQEVGVGVGSPTGSTLWARDLSAIGDKDNTYSATVYMTFKISR